MKEREKTPELERERRKGERMGSERERISEREKGTYGIRQSRQIKANNVCACVRLYSFAFRARPKYALMLLIQVRRIIDFAFFSLFSLLFFFLSKHYHFYVK